VRFVKEEKPFIKFVCNIPGFEQIEEIQPKPAKRFLPDWWKDMPLQDQEGSTAKACPSMGDYFSNGYVLPMWMDATFQHSKEKDGFIVNQAQAPMPVVSSHRNSQLIDHADVSFNGKDASMIFKLDSPWSIITAPGYSVLQLPMFYNFNKNFTVLPGIIDTDIYNVINVQMLYHGNGEEVFIKRGDPLCVYIPFKRTKYNFSFSAQTEKEKLRFNSVQYDFNTKFNRSNWYRDLQRKRDKKN
jgi:hypothetical protein